MLPQNHNWCPVFKPTKDEFSKPFSTYVQNILRKHPDIAMFKVVPPRGWSPRASHLPAMDKLLISTPIKQHVFGTRGAYRCLLEEQKSMTVKEFRELANGPQHRPSKKYSEDDELMERAFWRSITSNPATYGADNPLSLFDEKLPYGWNLRNLGDLLKTKDVPNIPGVTSPMTYFGMWKSFFSWHVEDVDLLSINYLHFGASKVWYCMAPSESKRFEAVASTLFPDLQKHCSAFLRHKDIMFSPTMLKTHNIKYVQCKQEPGEFVVLNAGAYHAGYNQGFNCAEAVNFALEDWIPTGAKATRCTCQSLKDGVRIEMSIFGWHESSSEDEDGDEDEDEDELGISDGDDGSGEEGSSEEGEDGEGKDEEGEESEQSSMSCSDSCPGPGSRKAAQRGSRAAMPKARTRASTGTKSATGKGGAAAAAGRCRQAPVVVARAPKRQKLLVATSKAGKQPTAADPTAKTTPRRPRSAPVGGPSSTPVIVMMADGSVMVKRGRGRPSKDVPMASTGPLPKHPTAARTPPRPRQPQAIASVAVAPAAPPERSAVVKRALAKEHAHDKIEAPGAAATKPPAARKRSTSGVQPAPIEHIPGAADNVHLVYGMDGNPVDVLTSNKVHSGTDPAESDSEHVEVAAGGIKATKRRHWHDGPIGSSGYESGCSSEGEEAARWQPRAGSTHTPPQAGTDTKVNRKQGRKEDTREDGKEERKRVQSEGMTTGQGHSRQASGARARQQAPRKPAGSVSRTVFLEDGACPVNCSLAANQEEVLESEVIDRPYALLGEDAGKPFFCIMQKVRRRASHSGKVVLRQLKECMDGLFRPGDLAWEEQEDALKPIRMQFLPEQGRREGGYKLLTSKTSILASYQEQQL